MRFAVARTIQLGLAAILACALAFALTTIAPIDPIAAYLGPAGAHIDAAQEAQIAARWGVNEPPIERFFAWARNALRGDLGVSPIFNRPVAEVLAERAGASLALMAIAWICSGVLGFTLGLVAGGWRDTWIDRIIRTCAYTLTAAPTYWVAMILLLVFSVSLGWAPVCCAGPVGALPEEVGFVERLHHLALPAAALSLLGVAHIALFTRQKTIDVMTSEFVTFAKAQGASRGEILVRHAARHAAAPALMLQFATIGELFGGSVLAEAVFTYPGLGRAAVEAGLRGDAPLLLGVTLFMAIIVSLGALIADILSAPRLGEQS